MDPSSLTRKLEEMLICSICLHALTEPKLLPCHHAFCRDCLLNLQEKSEEAKNDSVTCPLCQSSARMPDGGVLKLPGDFRANQISSILHEMQQQQTNASKIDIWRNCYVCQRTDHAGIVCFDCSKPYCVGCFDSHSKNPRFVSHIHSSVKPDDIHQLVCVDHEELFRTLCMTCRRGTCRRCELTAHAEHEIIELERRSDILVGVRKTETYGGVKQQDIYAYRVKFEQMIDQISTRGDEMRANIQVTKDEITSHKRQLVGILERHEKELLQKLDEQQRHFEQELFSAISKILLADMELILSAKNGI